MTKQDRANRAAFWFLNLVFGLMLIGWSMSNIGICFPSMREGWKVLISLLGYLFMFIGAGIALLMIHYMAKDSGEEK